MRSSTTAEVVGAGKSRRPAPENTRTAREFPPFPEDRLSITAVPVRGLRLSSQCSKFRRRSNVFRKTKEVGKTYSESRGKFLNHFNRWIPCPSFNVRQVRAMEKSPMRKFLLGQILTQPQVFNRESESYSDMFVSVSHGDKLSEKSGNCPQTMSDIQRIQGVKMIYRWERVTQRGRTFRSAARRTTSPWFHLTTTSSPSFTVKQMTAFPFQPIAVELSSTFSSVRDNLSSLFLFSPVRYHRCNHPGCRNCASYTR